MTVILRFAGKWVRWYRALRYAKAFSSLILCAMAYGWRVVDRDSGHEYGTLSE